MGGRRGRGDGVGTGGLQLFWEQEEGSIVLGDTCPGEGAEQQWVMLGKLDDALGVFANDNTPPT